MTLRAVEHTFDRQGVSYPTPVEVTATLVDEFGQAVASTGGTEHPVTTPVLATGDADYYWTMNLAPNINILPAGTFWKIEELATPRLDTWYIDVPDTAGPHDVEGIQGTLTPPPTDPSAFTIPFAIPFARSGNLAVVVGSMKYTLPVAGRIVDVHLQLGTAATGTTGTPIAGESVVVDINKNGTTIFTTQANRPSITASATVQTALNTPDVTSFAAGDTMTADIDYKGSTIAGADLTIVVNTLVAQV